jgi:hypothetical protein
MERIIGVLGSQLRQPSNPFANLAAQAQKMAHVNALVAMWPSFEKVPENPHGSIDLFDGYLLLRPMDGPYHLSRMEEDTLDVFCSGRQDVDGDDQSSVFRWGRLKLPTEQVARSAWKELERCSDMARTDRNVKVCKFILFRDQLTNIHAAQIAYENAIRFAEIQFFFLKSFGGVSKALAAVSLYSPSDNYILDKTYGTLCVCGHQGEDAIAVIDVKSIVSVIAMVPFPFLVGGRNNQYFMVEQIGLDVVETDVISPSLDDV